MVIAAIAEPLAFFRHGFVEAEAREPNDPKMPWF